MVDMNGELVVNLTGGCVRNKRWLHGFQSGSPAGCDLFDGCGSFDDRVVSSPISVDTVSHASSRIKGRPSELSVVVPCFNEEAGLLELHRRTTATCEKMGEYEVILVNDGSRDGTWNLMHQLADEDPHLVVINLSRNHGHQLALSAGLALARGRRILIIDADLQDPPELLPRMMKLMDEGADVVYGQRQRRQCETSFKTLTAKLFYRLLEKLTDVDIPVDTGDFRLMSRRALDILNSMPEQSRFVRGMVAWIGLKQVPLLYDRDRRFAGKTKYSLLKMVRFAINAITWLFDRPP